LEKKKKKNGFKNGKRARRKKHTAYLDKWEEKKKKNLPERGSFREGG